MAYLNLYTLDYRLNGLSVNGVVSITKYYVENELKESIEHCSKSIFYKILKVLNLRKEFLFFVKERDASEEVLCAPFLKKRVSELIYYINHWARVFETEEEDRTNKKHRRHILKMLPYLKEIGHIGIFFSTNNKQTFANTKIHDIRAGFNGNAKKQCFSYGTFRHTF